jgi:hypothetical protein
MSAGVAPRGGAAARRTRPSWPLDVEFTQLIGTPSDAVAYSRTLAEAGVQHIIVGVADAESLRQLAPEMESS